MRYVYLNFICLLSIIVLTSCVSKNESTTETIITPTTEELQIDSYEDIINNRQDVMFDGFSDMPLINDGILYGYVHINYVERLGIWDYSNHLAIENGVKCSYAINCTIKVEDYVTDNRSINLQIIPKLYNSMDELIGSSGYVGWSGYNDIVELINILQPTDANEDNYAKFKLCVSDITNSILFDELCVNLSCITGAADGAFLKSIDDVTEIECINGAIYDVSFHDVYIESHKVKRDSFLKSGNYFFYDFQYDLDYLTAPTNDREVLNFDSFNNWNLISAPIMCVISDQDSTKLYDNVDSAEQLLWSNRTKTTLYVTHFPEYLSVGESCTVSSNRYIPSSTEVEPSYVRIILEFPSEAKARTSEEMRSFNGRYVVYQIPLGHRELQEEPK